MYKTKILAGLFSDTYVNANIKCNDGRKLQDDEVSAIIDLLAKQATTATSFGCKNGYLSNSLHLLTFSIVGQGGVNIKTLPIFSSVKATRISGSISFYYDLDYNPEYLYLVDLMDKKINSFQRNEKQIPPLSLVSNNH